VGRADEEARLSALVDTNVIVRHLTGDPPELARRATSYLQSNDELFVPDLVVAEIVFVLESYYELERSRLAGLVSAVIALPAIVVDDEALLIRALDVYEVHRLGFADSYLVAAAEQSGVGAIASFDRALDRVKTIRRLEPA
jgi:predicted nucleic acid-binding protein